MCCSFSAFVGRDPNDQHLTQRAGAWLLASAIPTGLVDCLHHRQLKLLVNGECLTMETTSTLVHGKLVARCSVVSRAVRVSPQNYPFLSLYLTRLRLSESMTTRPVRLDVEFRFRETVSASRPLSASTPGPSTIVFDQDRCALFSPQTSCSAPIRSRHSPSCDACQSSRSPDRSNSLSRRGK